MQTVLEVNNISKNYGKIQALQNVQFAVQPNCVFGVLGPNGSGKTTLLGIITNVLQATSGSYTLLGQAPSHLVRQQIGTLLETPNFYHYLSAVQNLKIVCEIKNQPYTEIDRVLSLVNLLHRKNSKFSTYSLGMKQRLAIASALIGNPDVLVLDEPTNGLDPVGIAEIRTLILQLAATGKTIIMASHLLDEVEKVCTHVAILKNGVLLGSGAVDDVLANEEMIEIAADNMDKLASVVDGFGGFTKKTATAQSIVLYYKTVEPGMLASINKHCFEQGIVLHTLSKRKKTLETKFLELTN
ncbi:MAG: ATP-binding cassette domain-containing protein [Bacteroidetes bacterium]|nr:MAG: ATP-binding cassette domain-containing protein [Bacteroidota bacterium]TAE72671.1 MAG: ATP-binding cassette domain-containing protein [Bacteroidota bacterium]TAF93905.1 MAG: ATP-binding cassette domain-containing protein [Bacteroidota bacterium]